MCGAVEDNIAVFVEPAYLPMQKLEKITPSKSSALNSPVISLQGIDLELAFRRMAARQDIAAQDLKGLLGQGGIAC